MYGILTIAFRLIFFGAAFAQMFAVMDGVDHFTGWSMWFWLPLSTIVMMIPGLNTAVGIYGAISVWQWPWYIAVPLMLPGTLILIPMLAGDLLDKHRRNRNIRAKARVESES